MVNHFLQNMQLYWQKTEGDETIQFEGTPFSVAETKLLNCQFGPKYFKITGLAGLFAPFIALF